MKKSSTPEPERHDDRAVSLKPSSFRPAEEDEDGISLEPTYDGPPDDPVAVLDWLRRFSPAAPDSEVQPTSAALPGYLKEGVAMLRDRTGCLVLAYTATGALHRGADWLHKQPEVPAMRDYRRTVQRCGWSTSSLDWSYTLRGCGQRDHIELRRVGKVFSGRVHRLKDTLGLSLRVTAGLCILFGIVDLDLRGAVGRQASEQARDFLAELESRLVLARDLATRAERDPAPVTATSREQLRSTRHR